NSIKGLKEDITIEYLTNKENEFLYWGDIDKTGLSIYTSLKDTNEINNIRLFEVAYEHMIDKTKENTLRNIPKNQKDNFECGLENINNLNLKESIKNILVQGKYIPQEALNRFDLEEYN
ncbi:TPA: hypothetical protein OE929_003695, partial [Clostridioides difficile]|nr:hypothetical protein [Clostridioides difficile]